MAPSLLDSSAVLSADKQGRITIPAAWLRRYPALIDGLEDKKRLRIPSDDLRRINERNKQLPEGICVQYDNVYGGTMMTVSGYPTLILPSGIPVKNQRPELYCALERQLGLVLSDPSLTDR